jgi:hypothetical protein
MGVAGCGKAGREVRLNWQVRPFDGLADRLSKLRNELHNMRRRIRVAGTSGFFLIALSLNELRER